MPSTKPFFEYRHPTAPTEGFLAFAADAETVTLECRWPLDMDANEWADISFGLARSSIRDAFRAAAEAGEGEARDDRMHSVRLRRIADDLLRVEMKEGTGRISTDLSLQVPVSDEQLESIVRTLA